MHRILVIIVALFFYRSTEAQSPADRVNIFLGTGGDHGQLDPAASIPFGMIKPGPDTSPGNHSGYDFNSKTLRGFSQNRFSGVGCSGAGGNLRILPVTGAESEWNDMDKSGESGSPGYYGIRLNNGIEAELTATNETAFYRFTYPDPADKRLHVDLRSSFARFYQADYERDGADALTVTVSAANVCNKGRYTAYFYLHTSGEFTLTEKQDGSLMLSFGEIGSEIDVRVTVSTIDTRHAKEIFQQKASDRTFQEVKETAFTSWNQRLSVIEPEGSKEELSLFYSMLYRTLLNPVRISDDEGRYRGSDGNIHQSIGYTRYQGWSMWDNYRNKFALFSLLYPDLTRDIASSLVALYDEGKADWAGYLEPVPTVRTEHTVLTLLDLYRRGYTQIDLESIYGKESVLIAEPGADSPDKKLERAYDFWALSEIAGILGKAHDSVFYHTEAMKYQNVWKEYFKDINERFDIMHGDGLYEGTLWQYRWFVPFDVDGIINLAGGKKKFTSQLIQFFEDSLYNHGNQPDLQVPFMFNYVDRPDLTRYWVHKILKGDMPQYYGTHNKWDEPIVGRIYKNQPEAFIPEMDDDDGTMAAWYVLASMGLYPVTVGSGNYQLTAPIFKKITVHLSQGNTLMIEHPDAEADPISPRMAIFNGIPVTNFELSQSSLAKGGTLIFKLTPDPE